MFVLRRPQPEEIRAVLAVRECLPFSYPRVGMTLDRVPAEYPVNHQRGCLGGGEATFRRAIAALYSWRMYRLPWVALYPPAPPVRVGIAVAAVVHHLGFWSVNPCRVAYRIEEEGAVERRGFALGTLPGHAERGEERFTVEWHHADDTVWFELFALAGPGTGLTRLGYPYLRLLQRRFGEQALERMRREAAAGR